MTAPRIGLDLDAEGRVTIAPLTYLGGPLFAAFRMACSQHGARYNHEIKASVVLPALVPGLAEALRAAGFQPVVSEALAVNLKASAEEARATMAAANERLKSLIEDLTARGLSLYPFQVSGVAWLEGRASAMLCDEMGLGKTVQAVMSMNRTTPRAIITCPASLKGNWERELARWRPEVMAVVLAGRNSFCWPQPGQAVILNPDILPKVEEEDEEGAVHKVKPFEDCPPGIDLIADECHAYKSPKAKRTKSFRALARAVRRAGGRTWGLSGTPILNRPQELYALLSAFDLLKETFGDWPSFCRAWGSTPKHFGGQEWGDPSPAIGPILKRVMLRRRREEVLPDLPTKTRAVIPVDIDNKTRALCDEARAAIDAAGISLDQMVADGRISGAAFEMISKTRAALATAKIPAMMDLLDQYEDDGVAVVVFSAHRAPIQALAHRKGWAWFTGETPASERTDIVARFQAGEFKGLGATIGAGGVGHTLTYAHNALFVDQDWTPALNCQAEDRICRIGQDRGCIIRILTAPDTIDEQVADILIAKQAIIDGSIEKAAAKPAEVPMAVHPDQLEAAAANVGSVARAATGRRGASGKAEEWAKGALLALAEAHRFSARDKGFGESLAAQLQGNGELTDKQWVYAVKICRAYAQEPI